MTLSISMLRPLRTLKPALRVGQGKTLRHDQWQWAVRTLSSSSSTTARDQPFYDMGWLDEKTGLTQFQTLHELQQRSCQIFADNPLYGMFDATTGQFEFDMTYAKFGNKVNQATAVLQHLGVGPNDKIALIANNRWEWAALACAAFARRASLVPMYEAQMPSDWSYILNDAEPKALVCASQAIYDSIQVAVATKPKSLQAILCLDAALGEPHAFATLMEDVGTTDTTTTNTNIVPPTVDDLASLIYTSGTTGKPKGVELTHSNLASNVLAVRHQVGENPKQFFSESDRTLSFLPWAHVFGQTIDLWTPLSHGVSCAISRGYSHLAEDLQLVQPTALATVPTLFNKIHSGVLNVMETSNPRRKWLMQRALELGRKHAHYKHGLGPNLGFLERAQFSILDSLVLDKIRGRLGGRLRYAAVGGAACPPEVMHFMDSLGIPVLEGYGLTETSPVITMNSPETNGRRVGSTGRPVEHVNVFIVDENGKPLPPGVDGEICCTGPNVMKGYYKNPEATEEVISIGPNGQRMYHTGDMGHLDEDGFLKVTGRIKEQFKLDNGKYITPTPMENAIGMSRFIAQCVLVGANRPHTSVLIVPEWEALRQEFEIPDKVSEEELAKDPRLIDLMDAELHMTCYNRKKYEIPTKWAIVAPFTVANDMLTQKLSIRRHKVQLVYADLIDALYGEKGISQAVGSRDDKQEDRAA